jgi:hypothetical protein
MLWDVKLLSYSCINSFLGYLMTLWDRKDWIVLNEIWNWSWADKDLEGNGCGLYDGSVLAFTSRYRGKIQALSVSIVVNPTEG